MGDVQSGKTAVLMRYLQNTFTETRPTIGLEFVTNLVTLQDGSVAKLEIWDTTGSDDFKALVLLNLKRTLGIIIVYDVTNEATFFSCNYWLDIVRQQADKSVTILLMPNKIDIVA